MLAGAVEHALILTCPHGGMEIGPVKSCGLCAYRGEEPGFGEHMGAVHRWSEVGAPSVTVVPKGEAAGKLVAIGLVLLFVSAVGWSVLGGPRMDVLPFGWRPQPTDLLGLLLPAAGLVCLASGVAMLFRTD